MDNLDDLVHKHNNFILEALGGLRELPDLANREDHVDLASGDLQLLESVVIRQGPRHDLRTFLSKASLEQSPYLEDGQLQHLCLHLSLAFACVAPWLLWLLEWALSQPLNDVNDLLDWLNNDEFDIAVEGEGGRHQDAAGEDGDEGLCFGLILPLQTRLKPGIGNQLVASQFLVRQAFLWREAHQFHLVVPPWATLIDLESRA